MTLAPRPQVLAIRQPDFEFVAAKLDAKRPRSGIEYRRLIDRVANEDLVHAVFMTGYLGCIDASGTFHFIGRSKDLLRVKGINVSPIEVEAVLSTHPAVEAVYVVGVPPDGLEQRVVALVVPKPGAHVVESELRAAASDTLSSYKRPEHYLLIQRADVPLSGTSKPQRRALAELAAERVPASA